MGKGRLCCGFYETNELPIQRGGIAPRLREHCRVGAAYY
jgi:hypothetical protein